MVTIDLDPFADAYLNYLLQGNRAKASELAKQYVSEKKSIQLLYEKVFKPALYLVGELWETNKISVASEHMATAITEGILNELYQDFEEVHKTKKKVVLTCVEHEQHQVGIKMVADVFELNGWESFFLGTGIPVPELIRYLDEQKPDLLAVSLSIYFNFSNLLDMIGKIKEAHPELTIIIGGQAFQHLTQSTPEQLRDIVYIPDLFALEQHIHQLKQ